MTNQNNRTQKTNTLRLDHANAPWRRNDRVVRITPPNAVLTRKELQEAVAEMLG
jgi:hypothetical protein